MASVPPTVLVVVLDAVGKKTIEHYLSRAEKDVRFPNLEKLGLGNILADEHHHKISPSSDADLAIAVDATSAWADSVMGHRELCGYIDSNMYQLFNDGMPSTFINELAKKTKRDILFNQRAGGMDAIERNHAEHMRTRGIIFYTSMCDPLIQLAAYEDIISHEQLFEYAQIAFKLAEEMHINITRAITRPYLIKNGNPVRTANRRDVVLQFPSGVDTLIDVAASNGVYTISIGKCADVVNTNTWKEDMELPTSAPELDSLYTSSAHKDKNPLAVSAALHVLRAHADVPRLVFCNLPDTDSLFGHVRDVSGALASIAAFDRAIPIIKDAMPGNSYLLVTADHGMRDGGDYGYHNKEPVPLLGMGKSIKIVDNVDVPQKRETYGVVGYICAQLLGFGPQYVERCKLGSILK